MPRDYSKGKIYKIVDNTSELVYVGSTTEPTLSLRLAKHVSCYNSWKRGKGRFCASYEIIENENYTIVLLEDFPCENNDQLRAREQYYKEKIKSNNKINPYCGFTNKAEYNKQYNKKYREENIEEIQKKQKQFYIENIEEIQKKQKYYREQNREKIQKKQNAPNTCPCGGNFTTANKKRHLRSLMHQTYVQANSTPPTQLKN